jgi:hypothetical protein
MDNNIKALQNLYVALGGDIDDVADVNTNADMINAIAGIAATIKGLPAVKASDNGKILKVVEGEWALADDEIQA